MSRQACNFWAIDFGLPGVALAASAGAASLDAFLDLVPFGLTCTSGLSPNIGCFGGSLVCAMAAAEYSTAAITKIFSISLRFRPDPTGWKAMERICARLRPNGEIPNGFTASQRLPGRPPLRRKESMGRPSCHDAGCNPPPGYRTGRGRVAITVNSASATKAVAT